MLNLNLIKSVNEWENLELSCVGLYSINTVRMLTADIACALYNLAIVPLYDTLGAEAIDFILNQTKLETMLTSSRNLPKLLEKAKN